MILSEFLKKYRKQVNASTGATLSIRVLSELLKVDKDRLTKWEGSETVRGSYPKHESDISALKSFFGLDNFTNISESSLRMAIDAYPKPLRERVAIKETGEDIRLRKALGDDSSDLGLIYVPIAAQAGYSRNFEDPVYINQLERLYIPGLPYKGDKYRYFDIEGDSMEPTFEEGMQVIGEFVNREDWVHLNDYYIYVIVTVNRILIKRIFKKDDKTLILISDNEDMYPQEKLSVEKIKEMWLVKRVLDWRMAPPKRFEIKIK